ncbi:hypothetical protein PsYK624_107900 [Phanerochaete sordida]|uniref:Uncharacterized protein n=1 Tax=Phanerochaete sordida TaxID=48140 RepID=A0A9P3GHY2_9APHY|nr:hypothetical protein PsYK624_107900 [Phanerochaete sordida]
MNYGNISRLRAGCGDEGTWPGGKTRKQATELCPPCTTSGSTPTRCDGSMTSGASGTLDRQDRGRVVQGAQAWAYVPEEPSAKTRRWSCGCARSL